MLQASSIFRLAALGVLVALPTADVDAGTPESAGERGRGGGSIGGINYSGGGGGLYGGGSGASGPCEFAPDNDYVGGAGGGGGGSSLVPPGGTLLEGYRAGHGRVIIRYQLP